MIILTAETKWPPFPDDIFKCIFLNENVSISIKISLKFAPEGRINNIPALVQIMAWRRPGDKPLSEPMMVSLLTHVCVTRPQWVKGIFQIPVLSKYDLDNLCLQCVDEHNIDFMSLHVLLLRQAKFYEAVRFHLKGILWITNPRVCNHISATLEQESCHDDNFAVTCGNGSCHYDTRRYRVGIITTLWFRCKQFLLTVSLVWCSFYFVRNFWTNNGPASTTTHNTVSRWVSRWWRSWVGATKPISSVLLFSEFFSIIKTHVSYWISRLYLTGDAAAQLRWHMSNINVIQRI